MRGASPANPSRWRSSGGPRGRHFSAFRHPPGGWRVARRAGRGPKGRPPPLRGKGAAEVDGRWRSLREFLRDGGTGTSRFLHPPRLRRFAFRALFVMTTWDRSGRELCADLFMGLKLRPRSAAVIGRRRRSFKSPSGRPAGSSFRRSRCATFDQRFGHAGWLEPDLAVRVRSGAPAAAWAWSRSVSGPAAWGVRW